MKFKIGDRIRITEDAVGGWHKVGELGVVVFNAEAIDGLVEEFECEGKMRREYDICFDEEDIDGDRVCAMSEEALVLVA